jgi:hypothetical protein
MRSSTQVSLHYFLEKLFLEIFIFLFFLFSYLKKDGGNEKQVRTVREGRNCYSNQSIAVDPTIHSK